LSCGVGAWFLAAALQGCATKTDPVAPTVEPPAAWLGLSGEASVPADWWTAFGDPVLTGCVQQALAHNSDLRLASARVAEARAITAATHGAELPSLDFGAAAQRSQSIFVVTGKPYLSTVWQEQFQAAYEVDLWGRVKALGDAADASLLASVAARDAAALSVAAAAASSYIGLRALDERLDLARRTLVSREAALSLARSRQQHGYASKLELAQAESEFRATAQAVPQLELAASRAEHALRVLQGATPGAVERGTTLSAIVLPALPDAGLPSALLRRRPDIAASESQLVASDAQLAAAKAQLLPSLRLTAAFGTAGADVLHGDPFTLWSLGGSVLAPIFNGGRLRAQVEASTSRRDQALIGYEKTVLTAFAEVEDQLAALSLIERQATELEAQRAAVQDALRIAHNRFRAGYASYLEELDAQRSLFSVEQLSVQLRADLLTAHVNLYRALGGGWSR
jgi:outer membrane protein, multidrug efflux system